MRVPIAVTLESRDGTVDQDAKVVNGIVEVVGEQATLRKRPGISDLGLVDAGTAQLLTVWNGIKLVSSDVLNQGPISTIVSAPTQTSLTTANDNLPMDAQATNNDAATPRLFFKSREKGWVVNRAGTVATASYASSMGAAAYTLISLTRASTVATATMTEDVFSVGDTVTIASADQADYNGAQTVTAVTSGSSTPEEVIPITITRASTTATATTVSGSAHGLTSGSSYTIAGANQSAYNGSKSITTSGGSTFTYTVTVTPVAAVTWNSADKAAGVSLSGGDLTATVAAASWGLVRATASKTSGKWYWEVTVGTLGYTVIGVANASETLAARLGNTANGWGYDGRALKIHSGSTPAYGATYGAGDVIGVALDLDSGTLTFYKNGVSQGQAFTGVTGTLFPAISGQSGSATTVNFGETAFTYSAPAEHSPYSTDDPVSPASGSITVTKPAVVVNPTFTYTVAGSPATPATGTITATGNGGTVPGTAYINGYFCVMDINGVIWHSNSDDPTTWGATAFVTAQVENGLGKALAKSQNYLVAFKEWSTELFYDAQNETGSVFSPVENGFTRIGCANGFSVADVGGKLLWIAQTKEEQGRSVYMGVGLEQAKISTPDIDRIVSADDLATVHAYGLSIGGHSLYVLTLVTSDITLVYDLDSKTWTQWSSYTRQSSKSVSSITRSGTTATVTTATAHTLNDGDPVEISGATQTEYNGIFQARYVSSTVFTIEVDGNPTTPATGTIVAYPYTESYFKFTKAAAYQGQTLLLHETDGHLYQIETDLYRDDGVPINLFARTARMDGGSTAKKKMPVLRVIGDSVNDIAMIRWSNNDCSTFSKYRIVQLDDDEPELRRCGSFKRRSIEFRHVGNTPIQITALETEIT